MDATGAPIPSVKLRCGKKTWGVHKINSLSDFSLPLCECSFVCAWGFAHSLREGGMFGVAHVGGVGRTAKIPTYHTCLYPFSPKILVPGNKG